MEGSLTGVDVQRRHLWKSFRGKPNTIPGSPESVRLPSGILFAFSPESFSESARNAVRLHPGNLFAFARNPQLSLFESLPNAPKEPDVPKEVRSISSSFVEIYKQSSAAEAHKLSQIAGGGYRKALEFLVKDYCIFRQPSEADAVKKTQLGPCIDNFIDDARLKQTAKRAAWLGNDEIHYLRKWDDKDIEDLKILIRLVINWIHNSLLTDKYVDEMKP